MGRSLLVQEALLIIENIISNVQCLKMLDLIVFSVTGACSYVKCDVKGITKPIDVLIGSLYV